MNAASTPPAWYSITTLARSPNHSKVRKPEVWRRADLQAGSDSNWFAEPRGRDNGCEQVIGHDQWAPTRDCGIQVWIERRMLKDQLEHGPRHELLILLPGRGRAAASSAYRQEERDESEPHNSASLHSLNRAVQRLARQRPPSTRGGTMSERTVISAGTQTNGLLETRAAVRGEGE